MSEINPCCCIKLRVGAVLVGILDVILSAKTVVVICLSYAGVLTYPLQDEKLLQDTRNNLKSLNEQTSNYYWYDAISEGRQNSGADAIRMSLIIYNGLWLLVLVIVAVQFLVGFFLLYGIKKERPVILKFWIILRTICFIIAYTLTLALALMERNETKFTRYLPDIFLHLLGFYFIYVIYRLLVIIQNEISDAPKRMMEANATCEL